MQPSTTVKVNSSSSTILSASSLASKMLREWTSTTTVLPDAWQLYQLGVLLSQLPTTTAVPSFSSSSSSSASSSVALTSVRTASHALLLSLPDRHRTAVFRDLHHALLQAVQLEDEEKKDVNHSQSLVREAVQAVAQLYVAANDVAPTAMDWDDDDDLAKLVLGVHRRLTSSDVDGFVDGSHRALWTLLSRILWTGSSPEDLLRIVHAAGAGGSDDDVHGWSSAAAWRDFAVWQDERDDQWRTHLVFHYFGDYDDGGDNNFAQRDYALGLLQPTDAEDRVVRWSSPLLHAAAAAAQTNDKALAADAPKRELRRRIDQIRQVLPHLGEGFVEAALSCYKGDVETTLAALLEDDERDGRPNRAGVSALPVALQVLDRSLPRRRDADDGINADAAVAKEWTKAAIAASHAEAESAAAAVDLVMRTSSSLQPRDEYDDDYDDQYDDTEPFVADDGQTYDAVLTYNRVARQAEGDRRFWDEQRNTNRPPQQQQQQRHQTMDDDGGEDDDDDGPGLPRFRGPDKLRGGRVPRPAASSAGRGGGPRSGGREGGNTTLGGPQRARGGRGRGRNASPQAQAQPKPAGEDSGDPGRGGAGRRSARHKDAVMSRRRDRQKQASAKKAG